MGVFIYAPIPLKREKKIYLEIFINSLKKVHDIIRSRWEKVYIHTHAYIKKHTYVYMCVYSYLLLGIYFFIYTDSYLPNYR